MSATPESKRSASGADRRGAGHSARAPLESGLYLVATPIGNAADITLRALEVLKTADVIACEDTRVTSRLLAIHGIATPLVPYHDHNAARVRPALLRRLGRGQSVALVSDAGTPVLSDPGFGLVRAVIDAGARHGEAYWELPLIEEYRELLKTPYADLNNIGGKFAGAITAGLFLREFVPDGALWAHLDIAGPFILEKKWKYYPEGATGFGVKTFVELAESF